MNTEVIAEAARATLSGSIPFPEVVRRLIETGVEYYHVDYVTLRTTFYSTAGDVVTTPISYEGLPPVAAAFDAEGLRAAILDSQRHGQPYRGFTCRAMEAGVQGYFAFLRGQRVTYWGRDGEHHTEWFPGAGPQPVPVPPTNARAGEPKIAVDNLDAILARLIKLKPAKRVTAINSIKAMFQLTTPISDDKAGKIFEALCRRRDLTIDTNGKLQFAKT